MKRTFLLLFALLSSVPAQSRAQDLRGVDLNGFGGWSFGDTDVNRFLGAEPNGEYSKTNFALKLTGTADPSVQINAQIFLRNGFDGSDVSLDYAFVDWQLDNAFHIRAGKVKHPFGIYTEVAGLGTVRPLLNLPQSVYGPIALVSKSYRGIGVRGGLPFAPGWSLDYDIYGGGIEFEQEESALDLLATPAADSTLSAGNLFASEAVIGARVVLELPVDGLRIGSSVYSGRPDLPAAADPQRYLTAGAQIEYVVDQTWLRAEYVYQRDRIAAIKDRESAYYVEVARFLGDHWQLAAQYSRLETSVTLPPPLFAPDELTEHRERALGLNYWVNPEFGFKASLHWVHGNLIAGLSPGDLQQVLFTRMSPQPTTRLLQFGAQFSF